MRRPAQRIYHLIKSTGEHKVRPYDIIKLFIWDIASLTEPERKMPACPYCNAEIEENAAACPKCGRYFAVEVTGPVQNQRQDEPGQQHRPKSGPSGRGTIYISRSGFGCCGNRILAMACIVGGLWYRQLWVLALLFILLEFVAVIRRK